MNQRWHAAPDGQTFACQYRVQFIRTGINEHASSRYFIDLDDALRTARRLEAESDVEWVRVDRRLVSRWTGVA